MLVKLSKIPKHPFLTYWDRRICKLSLHLQNNLIVHNCAYSHSWEVVQNPQTPLSYLPGEKDLQDTFTLAKQSTPLSYLPGEKDLQDTFTLAKQSDCRQLCLDSQAWEDAQKQTKLRAGRHHTKEWCSGP